MHKLAIVHCRIAPGGALNVLQDLITEQNFQQAKIFTMHSSQTHLETSHGQIPITTAIATRLNRIDHRFWMPFYPIIMRYLSQKIKRYQPNHILISSWAIAKNIEKIPLPGKREGLGEGFVDTTLYLHSPMQYIWSHYTEYIHKLTGYKKTLFKRVTPYLRARDRTYTQFDTIYANSQYTAHEAKKLYNITATVKYPKLNTRFLHTEIADISLDYFVCVGRLVRFVREVDLIIKLFNHTKQKLLVIGSGPDEDYLKSIAGDTITFLGQLDNTEIIPILQKSRGLINLTKESFGINTAEALCLGIPVFGYAEGATPELVDHDSGILVPDKSLSTLITYFEKFANTQRNKEKIAKKSRIIAGS